MTFKIGDLVQLKRDFATVPAGTVGTISERHSWRRTGEQEAYRVIFTSGRGGLPDIMWVYEYRLELATIPEPTTERQLSPIESAQLLLGRKVLVKNQAGSALNMGVVGTLRQRTIGSPRRQGAVELYIRDTWYPFHAYVFEEIE